MAVNIRYGLKEVADVTFYDLATGNPVLFLDTLKVSNIEADQGSAEARGGRGNPKLLRWDFNKNITLKIQNALLDLQAFALQNGASVQTGAKTITKREVLTAVTGTTGHTKVTLSQTPNTGSVKAFKYGDLSVPVTSTSVTGADVEFADTDVAVGDQVEVYYTYQSGATAKTITIDSDKFGGYYKVVGDTLVRNEKTGMDEPFQIIIPKAKINSKFTLTMQADGDPTAFDFDLEVFKDPNSDTMIEMIKY